MPALAERRALMLENRILLGRLAEMEETLRAIRSGEVDALVVETAGEDQVFTLKSADLTYRLIVEQMQKGAATLSPEGVVLYSNPYLAVLLEVPLETMLGAPLAAFLDEHEAASVRRLLLAAEGGVSRGEVAFLRGKCCPVPTRVSLTRLPLDDAHVFCMIVTDLTEDKRRLEERAQLEREQAARAAAEGANRIAAAEIERRKLVEEALRQAEIERTELLEREHLARTQAEEANRLKDEFLATLSHELRSPVGAIMSWAHILRQPGIDAATFTRAVGAIERNARSQTLLVADILDVSRIVTGKFQMYFGPVQLADVIDAAVDTVRPAATAKDIVLEIVVDPTTGPVLGDAGRLQQVVWNLLSNAIRFATSGGRVQLRVQVRGADAELSVTDDGPGIDAAFLPYVFDRFRQADSSSTRRHTGLGLGLAIVRHLVELHGGRVEARNRVGQPGAVFVISLPRQLGAASAATSVAPPEVPLETRVAAVKLLQDVHVLLVDDDADMRDAMALGLGRYGARVVTASCVREGFGAFDLERPQVLVTDIGMPNEDGYALLQKVRALSPERGGDTPAIALTAYARAEDRRETLLAGFQMHISKPATPADLAAAVAGLLAPHLARARAHGARGGQGLELRDALTQGIPDQVGGAPDPQLLQDPRAV